MAALPSTEAEDDGGGALWSPREMPRLQSQGSLRLRTTLQSQASLKNFEAASLLRSGSMKVRTVQLWDVTFCNVALPSGDAHVRNYTPCAPAGECGTGR